MSDRLPPLALAAELETLASELFEYTEKRALPDLLSKSATTIRDLNDLCREQDAVLSTLWWKSGREGRIRELKARLKYGE